MMFWFKCRSHHLKIWLWCNNSHMQDLGHLVENQQEQFDKLEENIDTSNDYAQKGLEQIQEANRPSTWKNPLQNEQTPGDSNLSKDGVKISDESSAGFSFPWPKQFDSLKEDIDDMHKDVKAIGSDMMRKGKMIVYSCTAMADVSASPML